VSIPKQLNKNILVQGSNAENITLIAKITIDGDARYNGKGILVTKKFECDFCFDIIGTKKSST